MELSSPGVEIHSIFYGLTGIAQHMQDKRLESPGLSPSKEAQGHFRLPCFLYQHWFKARSYPPSTSGESIANYWVQRLGRSQGRKGKAEKVGKEKKKGKGK